VLQLSRHCQRWCCPLATWACRLHIRHPPTLWSHTSTRNKNSGDANNYSTGVMASIYTVYGTSGLNLTSTNVWYYRSGTGIRCIIGAQQMAGLFCVKWGHGGSMHNYTVSDQRNKSYNWPYHEGHCGRALSMHMHIAQHYCSVLLTQPSNLHGTVY